MIARRFVVATVATAVAMAIALPRAAAAQIAPPSTPPQVSGPLSIMWEDRIARGGQPVIHTRVYDEATRRSYEVAIDSVMARSYGGVLAMSGRRVRLAVGPAGRVRAIHAVTGVAPRARLAARANAMIASQRVVVLLCKFTDSPASIPTASQYQALWFSGGMSVRSYWAETSNGVIDVTGTIRDWVTLSGPEASFKIGDNPDGQKIADECVAAHDAAVDYTQYDVISLEIAMDFHDREFGGLGTVTRDGVTRPWGSTMAGLIFDPVTHAILSPEIDVGIHSHEMGHAMDLFHSGPQNGRTYESGWDVMSAAAYVIENGTRLGAQTIAGHKDFLGFIPAARRFVATGAANTITLERSALPAENSNYLMAVVPITYMEPNERFYTVELRKRAGYDRVIPLEGVVIHDWCNHCRPEPYRVIDVDGNTNPNDAGAVLTPGETWEDRANQISVTVESMDATSARVTIRNGAGRSFSLSATGRKTTVTAGAAAVPDSIDVRLGGYDAPTTSWRAANESSRGSWLHLVNASGTGAGKLRFRRDVTSLASGTYIDTVRVSTPASLLTKTFIDTLQVDAGGTMFLGLSVVSRLDSNLASILSADSALVRITGPGAATAAWTATSRRGTSSLETTGGTGDGVIKWVRFSQASTPVGFLVDTITVSLTSNSAIRATIVDTLRVVESVRYTLSTRGRRDSMPVGGAPHLDSMTVEFAGSWATTATWYAQQSPIWEPLKNFIVPVRNFEFEYVTNPKWRGVGNGKAYYRRQSDPLYPLAPGTYIDTLRIRGPFPLPSPHLPTHQGEQLVIDTLVVYALPVPPPGLTLSSYARHDTIAAGMHASVDSVLVTPVGPDAATTAWSPTAPASINVYGNNDPLLGIGGKGSQWLRWSRNVDGLSPGTYANVITVTTTAATPFSKEVADTVVVLSGTMLSPGIRSRRGSASAGLKTAVADSVEVNVFGANASTTAWSATKRRGHTTLTAAAGTGAGYVRWTRSAESLAAGTYVDTIALVASGIRGAAILDTFVVGNSIALARAKVQVESDGGVIGMSVPALLSIDLAPAGATLGSYAASLVWDSLVVRFDSVKAVAGGFASPSATELTARSVKISASDASGKSGAVSLARLYFHIVNETAGSQSAITPTFTSALSAVAATDLLPLIDAQPGTAVVLPGALRGDLNLDGKLTNADVQALVRSMVGITPAGIRALPNGDANCNGKIEAIDAQIILRKLAGLAVDQFCVGTIK
jgi:M6 family metalloprotease-like protein